MKIHHGVDLISVARIQVAMERNPERFAERVLTEAEYQAKNDARKLAKHWAVKEAFAKACGTGIRAPVTWHSMWLSHDHMGKPEINVDTTVRQYLAERNIHSWDVSLSDEENLVIASVVMLES